MRVLTKAIVINLAGAVLTTATAGYFVFAFTRGALQATIIEKQEEAGAQIINKIDRLLFSYYVGIQNIGEEEAIERTLSGALTDRRVVERRIRELPFLSGPWDELKIIDGGGNVVVSSSRQKAGETVPENDPHDLAALKEAFAGRVYYSGFFTSAETGKPTMIFAAPIRDQEKGASPIVGAVLGRVAWPAISEIIESLDARSGVRLYTRDGVLAATNTGMGANLYTKDDGVASDIERHFSGEIAATHVGEEGRGRGAVISWAGSTGHLTYEGKQWAVFVETPMSTAFAPATKTARGIVSVLLPMIILTSLVTLLFLKRFIIRPVVDLTDVTRAIAGGFLGERVDIRTNDEFGELAASFNRMTSRMQESFNRLKIERDKVTVLIESMGDSVMAVDKEGKIVLWNNAAVILTGWGQDEVEGKPFREVLRLVREGDRVVNNDFIADAITEKAKKTMENHTLLIRKDGTEVSVADSAAPIVDADGAVQGAIVIFRDASKEREVDRVKTDFVAIASHEMRTPLTLIKGFAERLLRTAAKNMDGKSIEMVTSIYRNSDRLSGIVNDFLDVVSLEEKRVQFMKAPFDVAALVRETLSELRKSADEKGLYMRFDEAGPSLPEAAADKNRTKQVLVNLLSNAIHYTEKGGVSVVVGQEQGMLKVSVEDTGNGIAVENHASLFKKFNTVQKTFLRTREYGSGLGLYISKLLVASMGGSIRLEKSSPGKGSTFSFTLPIDS